MIDVSPDLLAFLKEQETRGRNEALEERAATALASYNGERYGDEIDGCSKVVSRDVAEVCDHMGVSVIRVFASGDRAVEFEPDNEEAVQFADDATELINREFARKGYSLLHDWLKAGNIETLGIVKTCVERKRQRSEVMSVDPEADGALEADSLGVDPELGVEVFKAVVLQEAEPEFKDYLVPLEEFRINPEARDPDDALYVAHAVMKTTSELVEMGFDREDVDGLSIESNTSPLSQARDGDNTMWETGDRVLLLEEYIRFDADGDGIAERLCVHRVGNHILRLEPCDYQPFVVYCPFPMPGRIAGHSLADKVTDIQRINTALTRLALDGLYRNLAPRTYVPDDCVNESTYDDLLTVIPGGLIRYKGVNPPTPELKNDVSATAFNAIEFMIGQRESRTGITRLNQGLDADALNKTATGTALMQAQGQQMEEYLARNFGEAVARLMRLKLKLRSRYGGPAKLRVDGEFREIDPSQWPEEMEVVIRVGLGSGKKEQRLQNRMMLLEVQREVMMAGLPIVGPEQVYKSISGVVKDANLGSPADFVIDPSTLPPQEPQPSPEEQKVQAEMQMKAAELEAKQAEGQAKLELQSNEAALKMQLAREEAAAKIQLEREKAVAEMQMNEQRLAMELQLAERKMQMQERLAERDAERRDYEADAKIKSNRAGGSLAE